ncbi:hypothetical protein N658DRAFT_92171 [Parathielavia hyrcaniae]|uniref:Uncharacterized protein n=1 Tax=Parathielavia hyrcaniae TaxID=113614 RepID=A0AAN6T1C2_9PEZI|nr:hypothetical protein N658DRAFT_92171 [Parathielavia hyrcaniae]
MRANDGRAPGIPSLAFKFQVCLCCAVPCWHFHIGVWSAVRIRDEAPKYAVEDSKSRSRLRGGLIPSSLGETLACMTGLPPTQLFGVDSA